MTGQKKNLAEIERLKGNFPRFSIIAGPGGSGRKMLAKHIAHAMGAQYVLCDISVAAVRDIITTAYKQKEPTVYILPGADEMSIAAKNALLKVTEEPPKQAYFIMTVEDTGNLLDTLVSRGTVFRMEPYSSVDILFYFGKERDVTQYDTGIITDVCAVPGDVDRLLGTVGIDNLKDYFAFVELVIDNVGKAAGSNAFKIGNKLAFKPDSNLWDVEMFLRSLRALCSKRLVEERNPLYVRYIKITSDALRELSIKGIHRQSTFDMWVLDMREAWRCQ